MTPEINLKVAQKVLDTVDSGLVAGVGRPIPGQMCVEAAVCYALGLPHGDDPICVSRAVRAIKIQLNDSRWSSNKARSRGLRRLALAQLGSAGVLDDQEFSKRCAELSIRTSVPIALRISASFSKDPHHKTNLLFEANRCEKEGTESAAWSAESAEYAAKSAARYAAWSAESAAWSAEYAEYAAKSAARYAAWSAESAAKSAEYAAKSAEYAAKSAAKYAAKSAESAAWSAESATESAAKSAAWSAAAVFAATESAAEQDHIISDFCEEVVQILIKMNAPGCQWLYLTCATT